MNDWSLEGVESGRCFSANNYRPGAGAAFSLGCAQLYLGRLPSHRVYSSGRPQGVGNSRIPERVGAKQAGGAGISVHARPGYETPLIIIILLLITFFADEDYE